MAQNGGTEKDGKPGRPPVTLPALYELLQQWQPLEETDEAAPAAAPADNPRNLWRAIARATREVEASLSSASEVGEPAPQHSRSRSASRRAPRRPPRAWWDVSPPRLDDASAALVRMVRRLLRLLDLRSHRRAPRKRSTALAPLSQLPEPRAATASSSKPADDCISTMRHGTSL